MKVLDEVKRLRREVETLASRVASLEIRPAASSATAAGTASLPRRRRRASPPRARRR